MFSYKTLIRDKLVDNATVKALFSATLTGSCRVNMDQLFVSASYPQVLIGYAGGETNMNLDGDECNIYLKVECRGTGTTHPLQEVGKFRSAILGVIDDTALSTTTACCVLLRKFSEVEGYDEAKKVYWLRIGFDGWFRQNFNVA